MRRARKRARDNLIDGGALEVQNSIKKGIGF